MSDARNNILQRIRQANQHVPQEDAMDVINQRLLQHQRGPQPQWQEDIPTRFIQKVEQAAASYERVQSNSEILNAVKSYLVAQSQPGAFVRADTPVLNSISWPDDLSIEVRSAHTEDKVVLVEAFAAIAETGSIVMYSSKETPVSLNFLPDHFICVVHVSDIVARIEDLWEGVRKKGLALPRAINVITGPSRTADVEQIIQMGAHGPRQVHLLLLD